MNKSLQTKGHKEVRLGGVAAAPDRVRRGEAYGGLPLPPSVFQKNTNPKRSSEEQGGGCLARQGLFRRGRGEAARDFVDREEPFHTAAVDRTVARAIAASLNSTHCRRWGLRPRPGPSGNMARRWREDRGTPTRKV